MKKSHCTIIAAFSLTTFLFFGCNSEGNKKGTPYPVYSQTIEESKENGVFQFETVADRPFLMLDSVLKIKIKKAWVETKSTRQVLIFGKSPLQKTDGHYQLILNLNIDSAAGEYSRYFYFIGSNPLDTFVHYNCYNYYSHRIDTIKVPLYRETSAELPSKKQIRAFDTLTFVKK